MKPSTLRTEASQTPPRPHVVGHCVRPVWQGAGFFTLGFAVAVLAVGSLLAGAMGTLDVAESASAPTPAHVAGERTQPAASAKTDGEGSVVVSRAPSASPKQAAGHAASTQ